MASPFDGLIGAAWSTISATMGQDATWTPSVGGAAITARVLFQDPSTETKLGPAEFEPQEPFIEFRESDFPGLKTSVDKRTDELIAIGSTTYYIKSISAIDGGQTLRAILGRER